MAAEDLIQVRAARRHGYVAVLVHADDARPPLRQALQHFRHDAIR